AFISNLFHELEKLYQIDHLFTTSCHPQTDGMVERANRTIISSMAKLLSDFGGSWEDLLGPFVFGYNMTPHSSTKVEPYVAMFGREGRRPSESVFARQRTTYTWALDCWIEQLPEHLRKVWDVVKTNAEEAKIQFTKQYDRTKGDPKLNEGDSVLWFRPQDVQGDQRK
ncbi:MAG: transposase family protein, partial [Gammaproteobacteria bacterium]|nr:transposase family protein [Gammaproteobacteria bacterium]